MLAAHTHSVWSSHASRQATSPLPFLGPAGLLELTVAGWTPHLGRRQCLPARRRPGWCKCRQRQLVLSHNFRRGADIVTHNSVSIGRVASEVALPGPVDVASAAAGRQQQGHSGSGVVTAAAGCGGYPPPVVTALQSAGAHPSPCLVKVPWQKAHTPKVMPSQVVVSKNCTPRHKKTS